MSLYISAVLGFWFMFIALGVISIFAQARDERRFEEGQRERQEPPKPKPPSVPPEPFVDDPQWRPVRVLDATKACERGEAMNDDDYLVWSSERRAWLTANRVDYSRELRDAGIFSRDAAIEICLESLTNAHHGLRSELPVRYGDLRTAFAVDDRQRRAEQGRRWDKP
jgi:hypothetical protein